MNTIDNRLTNFNTTLPTASAQTAPAQQQNAAARQAGGTSGSADINLNTVSGTGKTAVASSEGSVAQAYTVEISEEGAALSAAATASAAGSSGTAGSTQATGQTTAAAASSQTANTATATASETDTNDLSLYSDGQLQQMLNNGKISRTEYNSEIAKREANQV